MSNVVDLYHQLNKNREQMHHSRVDAFDWIHNLLKNSQREIDELYLSQIDLLDRKAGYFLYVQLATVFSSISIAQQEQVLMEYDDVAIDQPDGALARRVMRSKFPLRYQQWLSDGEQNIREELNAIDGDGVARSRAVNSHVREYCTYLNRYYNHEDPLRAWVCRWVVDSALSAEHLKTVYEWFIGHELLCEKNALWLASVCFNEDGRDQDARLKLSNRCDSESESIYDLVKQELQYYQHFWRKLMGSAQIH